MAPDCGHDVGHAETAADLDQLATRDEDLASTRQRRQHQQGGGGVVVDDHRRLGAGERREERLGVHGARAALAAGDVVFQVGVAAGGVGNPGEGGGASGARPRLVWMMTPVAFSTAWSEPCAREASRALASGLDRRGQIVRHRVAAYQPPAQGVGGRTQGVARRRGPVAGLERATPAAASADRWTAGPAATASRPDRIANRPVIGRIRAQQPAPMAPAASGPQTV